MGEVMGKHRKVRGVARHARPKTITNVKRVAAVGAAAATVPTAMVLTAPAAQAATYDQWNCIAQFESGQRWHLESGDPEGAPGTGASAWGGGLQFQPASWDAAIAQLRSWNVDTSKFGVHASSSTKQQQILAAETLEFMQGPSAWATNGMSSCATLSPSMFSGGPNPWGLPGGRIPTSVINGSSGDAFPTDLSDGPATPPPPPPVTPPPVTPPPVDPGTGHHHWRHHRHHWHHKPVTPPPVVADSACDHVVVPGDTVSAVAALNGASLADVEAVNPGIIAGDRPDDYSLIFAGGHIHMPAGFCDANQ